jgi:hypothetical protein
MFPGLRTWRRAEASAAALASFVALISIAVPALDTVGQSLRAQPPEEQPEQYPSGAHRDDAFYFCTACHSFKIVAAQGMSRERWDESLNWMVKRHNMPDVQGEDRERILDYLASAFPERREPGGWKNPFTPK